MNKVLGPEFFDRPPLIVARELIGKFLIRTMDGAAVAHMIVETEAYDGEKDLACHARNGMTKRNAPMFEEPSTIYVYFTYGMHWMLNVVCREKEYPAAVLIRGVEAITGPARLTKALGIDKMLNAKKLSRAAGLWIEERGITVPQKLIKRTPRIGVGYAGQWAKKPWRFILDTKRASARVKAAQRGKS